LWKGNATALRIQVNDHHFYFIIDVEDTVWGIDMVMGISEMRQTTHTANINKGTVGFDAANCTNYNLANF